MRKISLWAKHHRVTAILLLIAIKLVLLFIAFFTGALLQEMGISLPAGVSIAGALILFTAIWLYPVKGSSRLSGRLFYIRQKSCDFIIALCGFAMITSLVNTGFTIAGLPASSSTMRVISEPSAEEILASLQYRDKSTLTKQEKRILKKEFKKQVKVYAGAKLAGEKSKAAKVLLIILTIVVAIGLMSLIAVLACGLACNGAETAAVLLLIFGTLAVVAGAFFVIRRITRERRKHTEFLPTN